MEAYWLMSDNFIVISMELAESDQVNKKKLLKSLSVEVDKALNKLNTTLVSRVKDLIRNAIRSSPEYQSIVGGELRGQLGVEYSRARIESILNIWVNSVNAHVSHSKIIGDYIIGSLTINAIKADYTDVLFENASFFQTENGYMFNWLEWLLVKGDEAILQYEYRTKPKKAVRKYSRTQQGLMFKAKAKTWQMPVEFRGSMNDNMVTRSLEKAEPQLNMVFIQELKKVFK